MALQPLQRYNCPMTLLWIAIIGAAIGAAMVYAYGRGEYASFQRSLSEEDRGELAGYLAASRNWRAYQKFHIARAAEREAERLELLSHRLDRSA